MALHTSHCQLMHSLCQTAHSFLQDQLNRLLGSLGMAFVFMMPQLLCFHAVILTMSSVEAHSSCRGGAKGTLASILDDLPALCTLHVLLFFCISSSANQPQPCRLPDAEHLPANQPRPCRLHLNTFLQTNHNHAGYQTLNTFLQTFAGLWSSGRCP